MQHSQIVTITFFRYHGFLPRWRAFGRMGRAVAAMQGIPGLSFGRMLGSGGDNGFSIWPNWGVYGLLAVWESEAAAQAYFVSDTFFASCSSSSTERWTVYMRTYKVHGAWDGVIPFQITAPTETSQPIGVLTRATIHAHHLWRFWRFVPSVSRSAVQREGLIFSIGIGELPLIQQATFSLWTDSLAMQRYAYQSPHHSTVVRKTRELGWYKEELFARFAPYKTEGTWEGTNPLQDYLQ